MRTGLPFHVTTHNTDDGFLAGPCVLSNVVVGKVAAGATLKIHDCAAVVDAAAGNLKSTIELDTRGSYRFDCWMRTGLVVILSGGAPDVTVVAG